MQIALNKPDLERFIQDQVKAGNYASPEAVVEAAIADLRDGAVAAELDDETVAAINEAEAQADRDGMGLDAFRTHMQRRAERV